MRSAGEEEKRRSERGCAVLCCAAGSGRLRLRGKLQLPRGEVSRYVPQARPGRPDQTSLAPYRGTTTPHHVHQNGKPPPSVLAVLAARTKLSPHTSTADALDSLHTPATAPASKPSPAEQRIRCLATLSRTSRPVRAIPSIGPPLPRRVAVRCHSPIT
jgi:hypothetical protein